MNPSKLEKLAAQVRTGGKGSVRRKAKKVHKSAGADDKKLQAALQRLPGFNTISGIEEVNLFNADGTVVHFVNPKVQASVEANTFAISGHSETKKIEELLPGIISQLGLESLMQMRNLSEHQHHHHHDHDHDHDHDHEHQHEHEHHEEAPAPAAAAEEKPAEKPAEEKPAEKPAEEKPAEEAH